MRPLNPFLLSAALLIVAGTVIADTGDPVLLNEILVSPTGTDDTEYVEMYGTAAYSLDGISLIVVEGDAGADPGPGHIDLRIDWGSGDQLGLNGFYLAGTAPVCR